MKFILSPNKKLVSTITISTVAITLVAPSFALAAGDFTSTGMALYDKIAMGGGLVVLIKGAVDIVQAALASDFPRVKQIILYGGGIIIALTLYPAFLKIVETTAKGLR